MRKRAFNAEISQNGIIKELFSNYKSHFPFLPTDPDDSFTEDIIQYANEEPVYILALGKPKTGTTTFCTLLAQALGLELISMEKFLNDLLLKFKED